MIRLPGGRKRSERLMKKNSFSNYMNTADNPLDEDGNEIKSMNSQESKGSTSNNPTVVKQLIELNNQCSFEGKFMYIDIYQMGVFQLSNALWN
ncbi:hypothetical protein L6452_14327 [Arctium lappa]|uniref:Uncharacterized protein n=1 Tax=Arctium lappa TaxID=4217 RepID=A0ACB9CL38_ARCLA|nr:hypothetical protein L6452_14327 [Arctium lappa]